jgi:dTDP-4-amino-4,6-dideoxygalactose transaminase
LLMIPLIDMKVRHAPLKGEYLRAIGELIDSGRFVGGPGVDAFENEFATYCGVRFAVGVGSGTEALWLALLALGIGPGDEVITVPMTFAATVEAICMTGATPVFVDIDERTYTMDPAGLERAITDRTKAVVPVHLFGQVAEMDAISEIATAHGLRVVEDAAQAHGARYAGRMAGSLANAGCFSFYPGKNLGAFGDGGAVVTDDEGLALRIRMLGNHGQTVKNRHPVVGWNSRLDGIQAAVLSIKLRHLDEENRIRRNHAATYENGLAGLPGVIAPWIGNVERHVHHLHVIRVRQREELLNAFKREGIDHGIHYPVPIHLQGAYHHLGYPRGSFPVSESCAEEFVSLPMYPEITSSQIHRVVETVRQVSGGCVAA